jgi:hypothetical protein
MSLDPTEIPEAVPPAPMDLGQIVDAVVALYRRRWALLLGLCAVLEVPATILSGLILLPLPARLSAILASTSSIHRRPSTHIGRGCADVEQTMGVRGLSGCRPW